MMKAAKSLNSGFWSATSILYKSFYFFFYAGYISFLLYVPIYFKYLGLSAIQVGLLNGIRPLMQTIGAPLWGIIGDRFRIRKTIFLTAFVVMTVKTMLFLLFRPQNQICVLSYYNTTSNALVKNSTYVIEHSIGTNVKRLSVYSETHARQMTLRPFGREGLPGNTSKFASRNEEKLSEGASVVGTKTRRRITTVDKKAVTSEGKSIYANMSFDENTVIREYNSFVVKYTTIRDDDELTYIFLAMLLLIIFGDAFDAAVFTLADTSCLDTLGGDNYGYYRLWGSAGWGIMTPIIGFVISRFSTEKCGVSVGAYFCIFYFYLGFMYLAMLFGSHFEFKDGRNDIVNKTIKSALLNFHYGIFLFVTFYAGFCYGFLLYFVNWYIDNLGGSALVMGTATACKSVVDVLFFFLSGKIIELLGHLNTVTISLIAYIAAFVSYSYIREPWYAVPIEVLHAGAYALVWSASVSYLNKAAPAGSSATVQGILQGVYWGLGTGGGTIIGGYMVHIFNFTATFQAFAVVTSVILVIFLMTQLLSKFSILPEEKAGEKSERSSSYVAYSTSDSEVSENETPGPELTADNSGKQPVKGEQEKLWKDGWKEPIITEKQEDIGSAPLKEPTQASPPEDKGAGKAGEAE